MNHTFDQEEPQHRGALTKERILDAAENLFATQGYTATSLRQITAEAGVNLAAVNYHFQSKDALILAVFNRKVAPLNDRRLMMLDEVEARAGSGPLALEDVLRAFLAPMMGCRQSSAPLGNFPRLFGRVFTEPGDWAMRIFPQVFGEIRDRFRSAFERALPGADPLDVVWGLHLSIGSMSFFLGAGQLLTVISNGRADPSDVDGALDRLVCFAAAGLRALASPAKEDAR